MPLGFENMLNEMESRMIKPIWRWYFEMINMTPIDYDAIVHGLSSSGF